MVWSYEGRELGTAEEWAFKSRTHTGQIRHVDTTNGTLTVDLIGSRERYTVDIPVQGLSFRGLASSWQRHMPQEGDFVEIGFGPSNRAYAVRVTTFLQQRSSGGYKLFADRAAQDAAFGRAFIPLDEGEFDLRSAGSSGYYFSNTGHATVFAGAVAVELDKLRNESVGTGNLWIRSGDGTEVRYGDVKRLLPGQFLETPVATNPAVAAAPKEWSVEVGKATLAATLLFYTETAGDVRDALGEPVPQGGTGQPLRYERTLYDPTGTSEILSVEVDVLGNVRVTQADTATLGGLDVSLGQAAPLSVAAGRVAVSARTGNIGLTAAGQVQLAGGGGTASDGVVLGSALSLYLTTQLSVLTAFGPSGPAIVPLVPGTQYSATVRAGV